MEINRAEFRGKGAGNWKRVGRILFAVLQPFDAKVPEGGEEGFPGLDAGAVDIEGSDIVQIGSGALFIPDRCGIVRGVRGEPMPAVGENTGRVQRAGLRD